MLRSLHIYKNYHGTVICFNFLISSDIFVLQHCVVKHMKKCGNSTRYVEFMFQFIQEGRCSHSSCIWIITFYNSYKYFSKKRPKNDEFFKIKIQEKPILRQHTAVAAECSCMLYSATSFPVINICVSLSLFARSRQSYLTIDIQPAVDTTDESRGYFSA